MFEGVADRDVADTCVAFCSAWTAPTSRRRPTPTSSTTTSSSGCGPRHRPASKIGEVVRIEHAPASDLLVIRLADGRTGLVPFVAAMVPEVDLAAGRIVLTPPDGLFDL